VGPFRSSESTCLWAAAHDRVQSERVCQNRGSHKMEITPMSSLLIGTTIIKLMCNLVRFEHMRYDLHSMDRNGTDPLCSRGQTEFSLHPRMASMKDPQTNDEPIDALK
jgi:hypothetical protein